MVENYFDFWKVMPVKSIYNFNVLCLKYFSSHGEQRSHNYETRISRFDPMVMPINKDKYFEHTFEYIVPRLWSMLPLEHKNYGSLDVAKRNLKDFFKLNL
jgi:hypothetical protein